MRTNGRTRITSRLPARVDRRNPNHLACRGRITWRRQAVALARDSRLVAGAERSAQSAFDMFGHLGECHFAVERRKNGAADQSRAAQSCQDSAAEPLHGDAAAIDNGSFRTVDGQRGLMTEINDPGTPVVSPA